MQVEQWLSFVHTQLTPVIDDNLAEINSWLALRTFLVGSTATLADMVLYSALSPAIVRAFLECHCCGGCDFVQTVLPSLCIEMQQKLAYLIGCLFLNTSWKVPKRLVSLWDFKTVLRPLLYRA
jgi:hypothetical protein